MFVHCARIFVFLFQLRFRIGFSRRFLFKLHRNFMNFLNFYQIPGIWPPGKMKASFRGGRSHHIRTSLFEPIYFSSSCSALAWVGKRIFLLDNLLLLLSQSSLSGFYCSTRVARARFGRWARGVERACDSRVASLPGPEPTAQQLPNVLVSSATSSW